MREVMRGYAMLLHMSDVIVVSVLVGLLALVLTVDLWLGRRHAQDRTGIAQDHPQERPQEGPSPHP